MKITEKLQNKKILIWGKGREGKSSEKFLKEHVPTATYDMFEGKEDQIRELSENYDLILKSPGIVTKDSNPKYISQTRLFMEEFRGQVIGITGTKGKSTTSSLLYHVLHDLRDGNAILCGNIGLPCFDYYDDIKNDTLVVYELSCHQLSDLETSPHIAVFLNLYEDHLDRYITMENYFNAKKNITIHQKEGDFLFYGNDVPEIDTKAKKVRLNFDESLDFSMKLQGAHNRFNATFVFRICTEVLGLDADKVRKSIESFTGLHHRLEFIGNYDGIDFYNDSISTIPQATIQAATSIANTGTLLIGGMDRGIDYDTLIAFIKEHAEYQYIFAYESGKRIYDELGDLPYCHLVSDIKESVDLARKITPVGKACIMSPAAASYTHFKDFEARGEKFCQLVKGETTLVFTGDIGFDRYMDHKWEDPDLLSKKIKDVLSFADHVIANVEGPIMECPKNDVNEGTKQLLHFMDPAVADFLKENHCDIWNICNNHIMDAGPEGIASTLKEAQKRDIRTIGAGMDIHEARKILTLPEAGGIGMFGVGYQRACRKADEEKPGCFSWSDLDAIEEAIKEIKKTCRWCIVVAHAGEEFTPLPSPYTRERYHLYLKMGADIVVSHHPHVPMNYETVGDKAIFYSLGNFIFDTDYQRSQFNTEKGLLLSLKFSKDSFSFTPYGLDIKRGEEHVDIGDLPVIFQDVPEEEYKLLSPLSTKMHIAATKRQMTYLDPKRFKDATEEEWKAHFAEPMRTGRVPGETLDFFILCPLAEEAEKEEWKKSKMTDIVKYIQDQM
ncbi:MAG: UDP-N-acetylmuramoyl-L-alanine--D-glutamate ligase [Clostridiales bacterium]|nr:UDP-N-acetylmuramoyl-L-alanine--D-glutamate ligase [Clostridiales bacterium]